MSRLAGQLDGNDIPFPERQLGTAEALLPSNRIPVVDPEGRQYPTCAEAARAYRVTPSAIRYRATYRLAGWRLAKPAPRTRRRPR